MQTYSTLKVWVKAHGVVLEVYRATDGFPTRERFGLVAQLRRSAASVASNIAEGCGRDSDAGFAHFLEIASGSTKETDYQLLLARDLGYLPGNEHAQLAAELEEVSRMLSALRGRIRKRMAQQSIPPRRSS